MSTDSDIRSAVSGELAGDPLIDADDIVVDVVNGTARLTGTVPDGVKATVREGSVILTGTVSISAQRVAAEDTVAEVAGVVSVTNEIEVQGHA